MLANPIHPSSTPTGNILVGLNDGSVGVWAAAPSLKPQVLLRRVCAAPIEELTVTHSEGNVLVVAVERLPGEPQQRRIVVLKRTKKAKRAQASSAAALAAATAGTAAQDS